MKTLLCLLSCVPFAGVAQTPPAPPVPSDPVVVRKVEAEYSPEARAAKLQGTVYLYVEVAEDGKPENVQVMHGLGLGLDEKALEAVRQWEFKPGMAGGQPHRAAQSVEIPFRLDGGGPWRIRQTAYFSVRDSGGPGVLAKPVLSQYTSPDSAACPADGAVAMVHARIEADGVPREIQTEHLDDPLRQAVVRSSESWRFKPGSAGGHPRATSASIELECGLSATTASPRVYRVGNGVTAPVPIYRPQPEYSEEASKAKSEGQVLLQVVIDSSGHTTRLRVIQGLGLGLDEKAMEAVSLWRFKPSLLGEQPVSVVAQIQVNFHP